MPVIALKQQIAVKVESSEGTEATSFAATDLVRVMEPELEFIPNVFDRNLVRESFGVNPQFHATSAAELRFSVELAGHSSNTSSWTAQPNWGKLLRGCGFELDALYALSVTSGTITSGPIQHGETLTEATSGETAVVMGDYYTGATTIYVRDPSDAFTGGLAVTGGTSGASFTSLSSGTSAQLAGAQQGWVYSPTTTGDSRTLTFYFLNDTEQMIMYGARGNVEVDCRVHDRVILRFTFRGIFKSWTGSATLFNSFASGVYPTKTPPAFVGATPTLSDASTTLSGADFVFNQCTFNVGNDIVMRESAGGANGYLAAVINNRQPSASLTIEQPGASTYNFVDKWLAGTIVRLQMAWGSATYNRFLIKADHCELASLQRGEVAQRATWDTQLRLTSGLTHGASKNTAGRDNELILFHL